ncbi:MAG: PEP-CTERM sorting domain-containing protein [Capsulimonadales bacterium]|nr:PEP-CTERM sorting domain-containing protein [Capsulimonadales bacterium]
MKKINIAMKRIAALALFGSVVSAAQAQELITNGGFEAGFSGWTVIDQVGSEGTFFVQTGTTSPINGFDVPAAPEGTQAAMTDAEAAGSHVLYQDLVLPTEIGQGILRFSVYVNSGDTFRTPTNLDWAATNRTGALNLNQQARVDLLSALADPFSVASADIVTNVFRTTPTDPLISGYTDFAVDITPFLRANAGQTVRLRFAEVDNVSFFNFGVDRVSLLIAAAPEPGTFALLALGVAAFVVRRRRNAA